MIYLQTHYMLTQDCNSPILTTISSMARCMAIFIAYGTASMAHKIPMKLYPCMISCRRFWALYTHTMITNNLVWYRFKHHMHTSSLRIHSRSKCIIAASQFSQSMNVVNKHIDHSLFVSCTTTRRCR